MPGEEQRVSPGVDINAGAGALFIFLFGGILIGVRGRAHEPGQALLEGVFWLVPLVRLSAAAISSSPSLSSSSSSLSLDISSL